MCAQQFRMAADPDPRCDGIRFSGVCAVRARECDNEMRRMRITHVQRRRLIAMQASKLQLYNYSIDIEKSDRISHDC